MIRIIYGTRGFIEGFSFSILKNIVKSLFIEGFAQLKIKKIIQKLHSILKLETIQTSGMWIEGFYTKLNKNVDRGNLFIKIKPKRNHADIFYPLNIMWNVHQPLI